MANSNFIETKKAINDITTAVDAQITSVTKLNTEVIQLNTNYSKLPSDYLKTQQKLAETNKQLTQTEVALTNAVKKKQALTSEEIVNQQVLRTNADRHARANSQLAGAYRNLSSQVAIASERYQNIIVRGRTAEQTQRQYNRELRQAQNEFRTLQNRVLQADKAVDKWNRTNERSIGLGRDLLGAFGIVGGVTAFALIARDIFEQTKEIQSLNKSLELVTGTQENFYNQQVFLQRISEAYGVELNGLTKQFTQFYVSAKDKLAGAEIQSIFESITKAGASMGLSVESQQRAFLALNQMMSKGTIQAEELRGQLGEALPGAFGIMAKAVGVTEKELGKMMKAGELIASEVLPKFARELEKVYGIENVNRIETLTASQNRLSNAWRNFIAELDKGDSKISSFFKTAIDLATDFIKLISPDKKAFQIQTDNKARGELQILKELNEIKQDGIQTDKQLIETAKLKRDYSFKIVEGLDWELNALQRYGKEQAEIMAKSRKENPYFYANTKQYVEAQKELEETNKKIRELAVTNGYYRGVIKGTLVFEKELNDERKKGNDITTKTKKQLEEEKRLREQLAKAIEDGLKNKNLREISDYDRYIFLLEQRLENDKAYTSDKIKLADEILKTEKAKTEKQFLENLRIHKDSLDLMAIDANNYRTQTEENEEKHQKRILDIKKKSFDEFLEHRQKYGRPADEETYGQGVNYAPTSELDELINKWDDYKDKQKEALDETKSYFENHGQEIVDLSQELINTLAEISNQRYENQLANLEKEKNTALLFAGDSVSAREEIERQAEVRRRAILARQAKAQKEMAIFNIITDTAQAVVASLIRDPSGTLAILIGAIGAANLALVASQQVPAFEKGGIHDGGLMMVNDQKGSKYKEIIETPDGKKRIFNERNKVLNAPKGTKIYNATETESILFNNELNGILTNNGISNAPTVIVDGGLSKEDFNNGISKLAKTITEKESFSISRDKRGERIYKQKQNKRTELLNVRLKMGRYDV